MDLKLSFKKLYVLYCSPNLFWPYNPAPKDGNINHNQFGYQQILFTIIIYLISVPFCLDSLPTPLNNNTKALSFMTGTIAKVSLFIVFCCFQPTQNQILYNQKRYWSNRQIWSCVTCLKHFIHFHKPKILTMEAVLSFYGIPESYRSMGLRFFPAWGTFMSGRSPFPCSELNENLHPKQNM